MAAAGLGGLVYAVVVGSFHRYSVPATIAITALAFLALGIALNVLAHRRVSRIPTVGQVFSRLMHVRAGRIAVIAWWAFIGFHLFSK